MDRLLADLPLIPTQVFTGQVPFFPKSDPEVRIAVEKGERPERPAHMDLTDELWTLTNKCWDERYSRRPEMSEVLAVLYDRSVFLSFVQTSTH